MSVSGQFRRDLLPPARQFYEGEGYKIGRANSKGWAMLQGDIFCHESESGKSLFGNLRTGATKCFGCGTYASSVVDFVMRRYGLSFKEACQKLGCWDESPTPETVRKLEAQAREGARKWQIEAHRQAEEHRRRIALRDQLHAAGRDYRETAERLSELRQGATPDWPNEQEACWGHLSVTLEDLRELERCYCAAAGLEYSE